MAKVLVSEKYLHDIANAIRVKLDSQSTYTPAQMAAEIADITGSISGTITPSTDADKVLVTDSSLTAIANAIRAKLDVATTYTPAQMAEAILSIQAAGPSIASWASGTDEEVAAMIDAAHAGTIDLQQDGGWAVGDVRTIVVGAFNDTIGTAHAQQSVDIVISSFEEYMGCGNVMQFDFVDSLAELSPMNSSKTNSGGYGAMAMKTTIMPALVDALPAWIKNRLITFSCLSSAGRGSSSILTVTDNKLALRAETEVMDRHYSYEGEGSLIPYYATAANRVKKLGHSGSAEVWWLRSPANVGNSQFCRVSAAGSYDYLMANYQDGIAPFGCL